MARKKIKRKINELTKWSEYEMELMKDDEFRKIVEEITLDPNEAINLSPQSSNDILLEMRYGEWKKNQ